jgi:hypothetical protein
MVQYAHKLRSCQQQGMGHDGMLLLGLPFCASYECTAQSQASCNDFGLSTTQKQQ